MACSLPVIAFENAGGAPEALADGAGLTVPYGDVTAMASALVRLASDPVWAAAFGTKAKERVGEYYNFARYADAVLAMFTERAAIAVELRAPIVVRGSTRAHGARLKAAIRIIFTPFRCRTAKPSAARRQR